MRLHKKNVLVTGGSRGIGRTICTTLAREGANVAFTYKKETAKAAEVADEIANFGAEARIFECDVCDRQKIREVLAELDSEWGCLDVLVNNAGINNPTDFDQISDQEWDEVMSVNLKGPFIVTQEALFLLARSDSASVINIGSVSGQYGGPRTAHYAASKAGLISLSQVIARFGAEIGIRSNTIAAGMIASEMGRKGLISPTVAKASEAIVLKRLGSAPDVANAVLFLASSESSYITAQTINVNGGLYF